MRFDAVGLAATASEIRRVILETVVATGKGHIGGAFSCTDILVTLYFGGLLRYRAEDPSWADRDRFILSKGHAGIALHAVLAELGFFPREHLARTGKAGAILGEHPDRRTPGVEVGTGSLGNGLGVATGLALGFAMDGRPVRTVALLGDGECYEGSVWEAAQLAAHHRLASLVAIIDLNGQCVLDYTKDCNDFGDMAAKWRAFGWDAYEVDGHDVAALQAVLGAALEAPTLRPKAVVARTVKGKGVSFMEGAIAWHHGVPSGAELERARMELSA